MKSNKKILLIVLTVILIIIFTPIFGNLYEMILGPTSSGFWGPASPENVSGFFIAYAFFIPLMIILFGSRKKYIMFFIFLTPLLLLLGALEDFIIDISVAIIAFILAQIILFIHRKVKK